MNLCYDYNVIKVIHKYMNKIKQCTICKEIKNIELFYKNPTAKDGRFSYCKKCHYKKNKLWEKNNLDKVKEYRKEYDKKRRLKDPHRNTLIVRQWRRNNPDKAKYAEIKNNARIRKIKFDLTFNEYLLFANKDCYYCGNKKQFGLDRINSNIGYSKNNVVTCCGQCNIAKGELNQKDFIKHIKKIINHYERL